MLDQIAADGLSQDTSFDCDMLYSEGKRNIEITQVIPPNANTTIKIIFCRRGNCKAFKGAIGSRVVQISVKIDPPAMEYLFGMSKLFVGLCRVHSPYCHSIHAISSLRRAPEIADRMAQEDGRKEAPDGPDDVHGQNKQCRDAPLPHCEEAEVL